MTCTSPKLRLVLILVVTLSILPVIAIISWFFTVQYKEAALIHLHHYAVTVAENVASAEADFIITENYASLQDSIMSFQRRVHVESITVTTPDGTVIADTDPENLGDSLAVPIGGRAGSRAGIISRWISRQVRRKRCFPSRLEIRPSAGVRSSLISDMFRMALSP